MEGGLADPTSGSIQLSELALDARPGTQLFDLVPHHLTLLLGTKLLNDLVPQLRGERNRARGDLILELYDVIAKLRLDNVADLSWIQEECRSLEGWDHRPPAYLL